MVSSDGVYASVVSDHVQEFPQPGKGAKPRPAGDENKSGWKFTASATVRLLCGVIDSTNGFGLLKSVAGGLYLVLENCEV